MRRTFKNSLPCGDQLDNDTSDKLMINVWVWEGVLKVVFHTLKAEFNSANTSCQCAVW